MGDGCERARVPPPLLTLATPLPSQITLIGTRVLLSTAKKSYRALTCVFGLPPKVPPPREPDEPADDGAGPRSVRDGEVDEAIRKLLEDEAQGGELEWGGLPWDPLGPRLVEGAQFVAARGKERPVTTAVVLAAALPFSGLAVCVGAPVLAGDAALQWGAKTPAGRAIGQGVVNAMEVRGLEGFRRRRWPISLLIPMSIRAIGHRWYGAGLSLEKLWLR